MGLKRILECFQAVTSPGKVPATTTARENKLQAYGASAPNASALGVVAVKDRQNASPAMAVLHIDAKADFSITGVAAVDISEDDNRVRQYSADVPRVVCRLKPCSHNSSGSSRKSTAHCFDLPLAPQVLQAIKNVSSPQLADSLLSNKLSWLRVEPVAANAAASVAWSADSVANVSKALLKLSNDTAFVNALAEVAVSLAAPKGVSSKGAPRELTYVPSHANLLPAGGTSIRVCSSYVRDQEDGSLYPALVLELQGILLDQVTPMRGSADLPSTATLHPARVLVTATGGGQQGSSEQTPGRPRSKRRRRKQKRKELANQVRSSAIMSALPCIATLLELDSREGLSAEEGSRTGRVLLQNELSLAYWGKLSTKSDTASWSLLKSLFKAEPESIPELMQQLHEQPEQLRESNPWKKVVQVRSLSRSQMHQQRRAAARAAEADGLEQELLGTGLDMSKSPSQMVSQQRMSMSFQLALTRTRTTTMSEAAVSGAGSGTLLESNTNGIELTSNFHSLVIDGNEVSNEQRIEARGVQGLQNVGLAAPPKGRVLSLLHAVVKAADKQEVTSPGQSSSFSQPLPRLRFPGSISDSPNHGRVPGSNSESQSPTAIMQLPRSAPHQPGPGMVSLATFQQHNGSEPGPSKASTGSAVQAPRESISGPDTSVSLSLHPPTELWQQSMLVGSLLPRMEEADEEKGGEEGPTSSQLSPSELLALLRRSHQGNAPDAGTSSPHGGRTSLTKSASSNVRAPYHQPPSPDTKVGGYPQAPLRPPIRTALPSARQRPFSMDIARPYLQDSNTSSSLVASTESPMRSAGTGHSLPRLRSNGEPEMPVVAPSVTSRVMALSMLAAGPGPSRRSNSDWVRPAHLVNQPDAKFPHASKANTPLATSPSRFVRPQQPPPAAGAAAWSAANGANNPSPDTAADAVEAATSASPEAIQSPIDSENMSGVVSQLPSVAFSDEHMSSQLNSLGYNSIPPSKLSPGQGRLSREQVPEEAEVQVAQDLLDAWKGVEQESTVAQGAGGAGGTGFAPPMNPRLSEGDEEEEDDEDEDGSSSTSSSYVDDVWASGDDESQYGEEDEDDDRWHEVQALPVTDPVTGKEAVLLLQTDITVRALMEMRMANLTETQLTMLENMFPRHVLEYMVGAAGPNTNLASLACQHESVTILFMDIVGFTSMSKEVAPHLVMEFLNELFSKFDELCDVYNVYKVETAGDCYIVAGALMSGDDEGFVSLNSEADLRQGARSVVDFAQSMLRHARTVTMPHNGTPTCVRIGIHTGSVVSGLIGTKLPKFSLFGDTMNTSSRMESTSKPGCIQISEATFAILEDGQRSLFTPTGGVEVKGKGLMPTYLYAPTEEELALRPEDHLILDNLHGEGEDHPDAQYDAGGTVRAGGWHAQVTDLLSDFLEAGDEEFYEANNRQASTQSGGQTAADIVGQVAEAGGGGASMPRFRPSNSGLPENSTRVRSDLRMIRTEGSLTDVISTMATGHSDSSQLGYSQVHPAERHSGKLAVRRGSMAAPDSLQYKRYGEQAGPGRGFHFLGPQAAALLNSGRLGSQKAHSRASSSSVAFARLMETADAVMGSGSGPESLRGSTGTDSLSCEARKGSTAVSEGSFATAGGSVGAAGGPAFKRGPNKGAGSMRREGSEGNLLDQLLGSSNLLLSERSGTAWQQKQKEQVRSADGERWGTVANAVEASKADGASRTKAATPARSDKGSGEQEKLVKAAGSSRELQKRSEDALSPSSGETKAVARGWTTIRANLPQQPSPPVSPGLQQSAAGSSGTGAGPRRRGDAFTDVILAAAALADQEPQKVAKPGNALRNLLLTVNRNKRNGLTSGPLSSAHGDAAGPSQSPGQGHPPVGAAANNLMWDSSGALGSHKSTASNQSHLNRTASTRGLLGAHDGPVNAAMSREVAAASPLGPLAEPRRAVTGGARSRATRRSSWSVSYGVSDNLGSATSSMDAMLGTVSNVRQIARAGTGPVVGTAARRGSQQGGALLMQMFANLLQEPSLTDAAEEAVARR